MVPSSNAEQLDYCTNTWLWAIGIQGLRPLRNSSPTFCSTYLRLERPAVFSLCFEALILLKFNRQLFKSGRFKANRNFSSKNLFGLNLWQAKLRLSLPYADLILAFFSHDCQREDTQPGKLKENSQCSYGRRRRYQLPMTKRVERTIYKAQNTLSLTSFFHRLSIGQAKTPCSSSGNFFSRLLRVFFVTKLFRLQAFFTKLNWIWLPLT